MFKHLKKYSRLRRSQYLHIIIDSALIIGSLYFSLGLRLGEGNMHPHMGVLNMVVPYLVTIRILVFLGMGCYFSMWRYYSFGDGIKLFKAQLISLPIMISITFLFKNHGTLPSTLFAIDFLVSFSALAGVRFLRRYIYEMSNSKKPGVHRLNKTLIYGAGMNGRGLAQRLRADSNLSVQLIGFLDDDRNKQGRVIENCEVLGGQDDIARVIEETGADQLIVAITNPDPELIRKTIDSCRQFNIQPQVVTNFWQNGPFSRNLNLYRKIELSDLLSRKPSSINLDAIHEMIKGKTILVTGAGGSIGSEIARQVLVHEPAKLLLLDQSEFNLYEIDKELRVSTTDYNRVFPLLVDIKDRGQLEIIFKEHGPDLVFHAAAYKHVHIVESNPYPAIINNIGGTKNLADLSRNYNVERFVMISTDKAVNPAGVMGATKRVCEMLVSGMGHKSGQIFCSVRFGNVLGSSGSLIPLLQKQILEGGPITITHRDMTRFFMLIPEAVSLVLMSSYISKPGDVNVLDMGEPVRIVDIAKNLIVLMGKTLDEIAILFTGLRPGEKMFEELYFSGNEVQTEHPDIFTLPQGDGCSNSNEAICDSVDELLRLSHSGSRDALALLKELVNSNYLADDQQFGIASPVSSIFEHKK